MTYLNKFTLIALALGLLIGRFVLQSKTTVIEKIKTVEVEKKVFIENKNKKEVKKEIVRPDGTKETTTEIVENSTSESTTDRKLVAESQKITKGSGVTLGLLAIKDVADFSTNLQYGLTVSAPIYGSLKIQALGTTDKRVGLGLGIDF